MNAMHLIQLILPRKERILRHQLKQHTPKPPDVHLLIVVAVRHEALRRSVPPRADVICVWLRRLIPYLTLCFTSARTQIGELDSFPADEYILWLDIAVEDALAVHLFNRFEHLEHNVFDALQS